MTDGGEPYDYLFKLLMVGDSGVGKSSILLRYTEDTFEEGMSATIGVDFKLKKVDVGDGKRANLTVWDTAGQEKFRSLTGSYYRGTHGIALVFDVGKRETFQHLNVWLTEVDGSAAGKDVIRMLVANKIDLADRKVSREEAVAFARDHSMIYWECSAKTRVGVQQAFDEMVAKIMETPSLREDGSQLRPRAHGTAASVAEGSDANPNGYLGVCGC